MMTALGAPEDRIQGIEAGADDFLTKPVNPRELQARIQTAVKWKRAVENKVGELHCIKDHFAEFVPEMVKRLVIANPQVPDLALHEYDVSVLFVDISDYTHLSEQLPPNTLNRLVERYFSAFLDDIQEAGGDINETAGDGFMAIFQAADRRLHSQKAVETAIALLATTAVLNQTSGEPPLSIHMGINSGVALVGSVRFEGLHSTRWTFTASGPVTNLAARLAGTAATNQILVGPETVQRLENRYQVEKVVTPALKKLYRGNRHLSHFLAAVVMRSVRMNIGGTEYHADTGHLCHTDPRVVTDEGKEQGHYTFSLCFTLQLHRKV